MKRLITILSIALLTGMIAIPAMAHGPVWGRGGHLMDCRGYGPMVDYQGRSPMMGYRGTGPAYSPYKRDRSSGLTAEQHEKLGQVYKKFYDDTAKLRNDLLAKQSELNTLLNASNPDTDKAKALQTEISDLRGKMAQLRVDLELEKKKIAPEATCNRGYGRGYYGKKRGGCGPGMMGPGRGRSGYGPGYCW
ncbi:MAG: periplasmic heavy metal sensor [Deltaproteobacteria bacterium]|nr:periplasmic heavy metal sensor [Deltaproteobacteria bacterium]